MLNSTSEELTKRHVEQIRYAYKKRNAWNASARYDHIRFTHSPAWCLNVENWTIPLTRRMWNVWLLTKDFSKQRNAARIEHVHTICACTNENEFTLMLPINRRFVPRRAKPLSLRIREYCRFQHITETWLKRGFDLSMIQIFFILFLFVLLFTRFDRSIVPSLSKKMRLTEKRSLWEEHYGFCMKFVQV